MPILGRVISPDVNFTGAHADVFVVFDASQPWLTERQADAVNSKVPKVNKGVRVMVSPSIVA